MKRALLALVLAGSLAGCLSEEDLNPARYPVDDFSKPAQETMRVCMMRFLEHNKVPAASSCGSLDTLVAIGFTVDPIKGDCESAFFTLHGFRQVWGCVPRGRD